LPPRRQTIRADLVCGSVSLLPCNEGPDEHDPFQLATCQRFRGHYTRLTVHYWCSTRTSLTEKCQDIADGIQCMDALERAASHEPEVAIRGACGAERQQSFCAVRGVRDLAGDRAQVATALPGVGTARARGTEAAA